MKKQQRQEAENSPEVRRQLFAQAYLTNGRNATQAAIKASVDTPGLLRISAGNYGGRLGKSFIYLHPEKQPG